MTQDSPLNFEAVCKYVGQLFLETRHQLEREADLRRKAEAERDQALMLMQEQLRDSG